MPVGVGQVKEAFAPLGVTRRGVGRAAGGDETGIELIDIGYVEYQSSPPGPAALGRLDDQVDEIAASAKTAERRVLAAIQQFKLQHPVKPDGPPHVVCGEGDGADAFDHFGCLASATRPRSPKMVCSNHSYGVRP